MQRQTLTVYFAAHIMADLLSVKQEGLLRGGWRADFLTLSLAEHAPGSILHCTAAAAPAAAMTLSTSLTASKAKLPTGVQYINPSQRSLCVCSRPALLSGYACSGHPQSKSVGAIRLASVRSCPYAPHLHSNSSSLSRTCAGRSSARACASWRILWAGDFCRPTRRLLPRMCPSWPLTS